MKIDPYKHKEKYFSWKEKINKAGIPKISKENSGIIIKYLTDMEFGLNVSATNQKGARSYIHLNNLKQRMIFMSKQFEERYDITDLTKITEVQLHDYFSKMRNGTIKKVL